ncbi:MAG: efflux RND transporter permease subunit, partial [Cyanobacteria bacterium REEB65]|nr:efflux RND transporter permease subunit [Cyanobacteria bacterium REEB65]
DVGHLTVHLRMPTGTRIELTEAAAQKVEERLKEVIEPSALKTVITNIGVLNDWPAAYTPNSGPGDMFIEIELNDERRHSAREYADELRAFFKKNFPEIEASVDTGGMLTAALNMGLAAPINVQVEGNKLDVSRGIAENIAEKLKAVPGAVDVSIQERLDYPQIAIELDRPKIARLGLTVEEVVKTVVTALNSSINFAPAFWIDPKNGNHYFIGAQYREEEIKDLSTLKNIGITGKHQELLVRLGEIASFKETTAPSEIRHLNIKRVIDVFANVSGRDIGGVAADIERLLPRKDELPEGYRVYMRGEVSSMKEAFANLGFGLLLAVILVHLVLSGQFRSFLDPLLILLAVPLGLMGVLATLWLTNTTFNIQSFTGVIFMVGIAVSNSILLVE